MSHHFIVPANENGLLLDQNIGTDVTLAMDPLFNFADVFIFSHGWWTNAIRAMEGYNRLTIEFSRFFRSLQAFTLLPTLNIGIHWPSTWSEDPSAPQNYVQALSFYTMEKRADTVGENSVYTVLRMVLDAHRQTVRIHLLGHSFGCKAVCKGLQRLVAEGRAVPADVTFDVILLQAAFDDDKLEAQEDYGNVVTQIPGLRLLITRSAEDRALGTLYPMAHRLAHLLGQTRPALGIAGPTGPVANQLGGAKQVDVGPGFDLPAAGPLRDRLVIADLTRLHQAHPENSDPNSGHHSDIFHQEIYSLLTAFYFHA